MRVVAVGGWVVIIEADAGDASAKGVINSRTGTVVIGSRVRVMPAAVSHGSLAVTISEKPQVSQPAPFSDGQTVVVPRSQIEVTQEGAGQIGRASCRERVLQYV